MENSSKKQGNIIAILAMVFLFAMIAFVTNLCSPMAVILKNNFNVSEFLSQVGNYGNFGAYLVMGVPAGLLITKFGYKKTALMALIVGIVGLLLQWVSGSAGFVVYLIGAFISGLCMCMLNTVVNPMLNLLGGGGNRGNQLVQIGGVSHGSPHRRCQQGQSLRSHAGSDDCPRHLHLRPCGHFLHQDPGAATAEA